MVRALASLALDTGLNRSIELEGGRQLLLTLARSPDAEVAHWSRVAQASAATVVTYSGLRFYW